MAFRGRDDRLDLIDFMPTIRGPVTVHSIYVGYLLPMMCELQWWDLKVPVGIPLTSDRPFWIDPGSARR